MKSYNYKNKKNVNSFAFDLCNYMLGYHQKPVFLCIGDTTLVSDSLGALVGQLLVKKLNVNAFVYGNLKHNITNQNLNTYLDFIKHHHPQAPIIVVDSALSKLSDVGLVKLNDGGCIVGGYTNKNAFVVGTLSILGIVNTTGINSLLFLKSVTLQTAIQMAHFIAHSISKSVLLCNQLKKHNWQIK